MTPKKVFMNEADRRQAMGDSMRECVHSCKNAKKRSFSQVK
jgi:hypothetical protein